MREVGAARSHPLRPSQSLVDIRVAWVRLLAQGVNDEDVEVFEQRKTGLRDTAHVSEISRGTEPEAADRELAVLQRNALKLHSCNIRRLLVIQSAQVHPSARRILRIRRKRVFKDALQNRSSDLISIDRQAAVM